MSNFRTIVFGLNVRTRGSQPSICVRTFGLFTRKAILTLRQRLRFQDSRPYDARCSKVAAALEAQFGWPRKFGHPRLLDARVCWQHRWNQLADGRILDATADQFESRWLGDLVVLEASDPILRPIS